MVLIPLNVQVWEVKKWVVPCNEVLISEDMLELEVEASETLTATVFPVYTAKPWIGLVMRSTSPPSRKECISSPSGHLSCQRDLARSGQVVGYFH